MATRRRRISKASDGVDNGGAFTAIDFDLQEETDRSYGGEGLTPICSRNVGVGGAVGVRLGTTSNYWAN